MHVDIIMLQVIIKKSIVYISKWHVNINMLNVDIIHLAYREYRFVNIQHI